MATSDINIEGLDRVLVQLKKLAKDTDKKKEIEKDLIRASKPIVTAAKSNISNAEFTVKRYSWKNGKYRKGTKDGAGKVAAAYLPGNLKKSIRVIKTKSPNPLIHIGAKVGSGKKASGATGVYGAGQVDGYYGYFVHEGTKFMKTRGKTKYLDRAFLSQKAAVENSIGDFLIRKIQRNAKKLGFETL